MLHISRFLGPKKGTATAFPCSFSSWADGEVAPNEEVCVVSWDLGVEHLVPFPAGEPPLHVSQNGEERECGLSQLDDSLRGGERICQEKVSRSSTEEIPQKQRRELFPLDEATPDLVT